MKTNKVIAFILLAVLFAGCSKDNDSAAPFNAGRIKLFAEQMTNAGNNSKLLMDPIGLTSQWLIGEQININGSAYSIVQEGSNYYLGGSTATLEAPLYAIYPATIKDALGNDIVVTNGSDGACAIDIHSLAVNFTGDGNHEVIFPMAALYTTDSSGLMFRHLTGGLKFTLSNTAAHAVDRLVITATQDGGSPAIYKDLKPAWAGNQLPGIPGGEVGEETGDQGAQFISTMTLRMNSNGTAGVTIPANGSITFCVPMLALQLKTLTITGYDADDNVVIPTRSKTITPTNIERNKMYTIPVIEIN